MLKEKERNDVWKNWHHFMFSLVCTSKATVVLFGDSIMKHLGDRKVNHDTWQLSVQEESLFLAQGGDKIENLLWRIIYGRFPQSTQAIVVHIGTNNLPIKENKPSDIAKGIVNICKKLYERKKSASIILTGVLPGRERPLWKVKAVNNDIKTLITGSNYNTFFIAPDYDDWVSPNGQLKSNMYENDELHLSAEGYRAFIYYIQKISLISRHSLVPHFLPPPPKETCPTHNEDAIGRLERII